jgi:hypothetical protein
MLAGAALLALWGAVTGARRRAVRRAAEAEARARARRRTVPLVSSNLHGQAAMRPGRERDLWVETGADPRPREP